MAKPKNKDEWRDYVVERSDKLWKAQEDYRTAVDEWLKAWRLEVDDLDDAARDEGKSVIIPNDPYNIVKLVERLLGGPMRYDVIPPDDSDEKQTEAEQRELWIDGYWNRLQMETGLNVRRDAIWWGAVAGRMCLDVRWVKKVLPENVRDSRLPVLVRALDPRNVLIQDSEFGWPLYGVHRYQTKAYKVRERWGDSKLDADSFEDDQDVTIHDFWDDERNVVVCTDLDEKRSILRSVKHEYPRIPFVYAYSDATPLDEAEYRGLSILHPMLKLWQKKSAIWSYVSTGLKWHFWPLLLHEASESGDYTDNINVGPGDVQPVKHGEKITPVTINPNVPLAEIMQTAVSGAVQDSTFPRSLYGQEPGVELAGFALANLSSSARGRIGPFREPMEWMFAQACELIFDLIGSRGEDGDDIQVWGPKSEGKRITFYSLADADLEQHMPIRCTVDESLPRDENQEAVLKLQEIDAGVLSRQTYRETSPHIPHAEREEQLVLREEVMLDEKIKPLLIAEAWRLTAGKEPPGEEEGANQGGPLGGSAPGTAPPPMGPPPMGPPPGQIPGGPGGGVPPNVGGAPPPGMMPGGSMSAGLPPIPPEVIALVQQGVPMQQAIGMVLGGGMPPQGVPPSMGQGMMPGMGVPPQAMSPIPMAPPTGVPPQLYPGGGPVMSPVMSGVRPPPLPGVR